MTSSSAGNASFSAHRDPNLAALLSILPGLGQLYNGQNRKGILFLAVAVINFFIFLLMGINALIISGLVSFGLTLHMLPNASLLSALQALKLGTPLSLILLGLMFAFVIYSVRDGYDHAVIRQRRQIYPEYAMEMPEATSSSYVLHFALLFLFFVLAIFFLKQSRPPAQITDIEFVQNQPPTQKKIISQRKAEHNSEAAGKHEKKPVVAPSPAPKAPSKAAPKVAPQPVAKPMPVAKPVAKPSPVAKPMFPIPMPQLNFTPKPMPTPSVKPMPTPTPVARPSASPTPSPSPLPAPSVSRGRGNPSPAPAPTLGTGPIISGAPGPAPIAVAPGNGGGSPAPMPIPAGGGGSRAGTSGGAPAAAPAPTRGGGSSGGGSPGTAVAVAPHIPRAGGGGGEGIKGNPDANNNPGKAPSVSAQADIDFGPYMADLQRRIKRAWFPPKGNESKRVVVVFKIHRGGELSHLRLDHSSGVAVADQAALKAVENAAPFRPLPAGASDDVDIQFTFDYNVFSGGGSGLFRRF